jgi:DEAD/DEAH box helicase/Helicase conserved C-terminal domain
MDAHSESGPSVPSRPPPDRRAPACSALRFSAVRFFVLDEADEMLNMGFQDDVELVLEDVPEARQTLFFSATMPQWVRKLARKYCKDYTMVDLVGEDNSGALLFFAACCRCCMSGRTTAVCFAADTGRGRTAAFRHGCCAAGTLPPGLLLSRPVHRVHVTSCASRALFATLQCAHAAAAAFAGRMNEDIKCLACMVPGSMHAKRLLLVDLITTYSEAGKTIVFCNTKRECETVVSGVSAMMPAEALHGDIQQEMREFTMSRFREARAFAHFSPAASLVLRGSMPCHAVRVVVTPCICDVSLARLRQRLPLLA